MNQITPGREAERYAIQLTGQGRLVLPAPLRERLGLRQGDRLVATVETDGSLRLRSLRQQVRKMRGAYAGRQPGRIASEELLRERREEARKEAGL